MPPTKVPIVPIRFWANVATASEPGELDKDAATAWLTSAALVWSLVMAVRGKALIWNSAKRPMREQTNREKAETELLVMGGVWDS